MDNRVRPGGLFGFHEKSDDKDEDESPASDMEKDDMPGDAIEEG